MFQNRFARPAIAVAAALLIVTAIAVAQATFTTYTARDVPLAGPDNLGERTFPGNQTHIRGLKIRYTRLALVGETLDPRVSGGSLSYEINYNLDANMSGPIWGTGHWVIGEGTWDGTLEGSINMITHQGYFDAVWHGGGAFQGLQLKENCVATGAMVETCTGRILQTPRD